MRYEMIDIVRITLLGIINMVKLTKIQNYAQIIICCITFTCVSTITFSLHIL